MALPLFLLSHIGFFIMILNSSITSEGSAENSAENSANIVMTNSNWNQMLEGEWMIKFYAPWCPACRSMETTWNAFADWANQDEEKKIKVGSVDVTNQPALNGRFMITSLPTIYHVLNGEFRQYSSSRDLEDFKGFIEKQEWREITPGSTWTSPTSFIMSTMSKLFQFSMEFKGLHTSLNTDYGFPTWLSMLLFGVLIITVGILLGVVLVFATDYFWGPPEYYREGDISKNYVNGKEVSNEDDSVVTEHNGSAAENCESKNSEEAEEVKEKEETGDDDDHSSTVRQRIINTTEEK